MCRVCSYWRLCCSCCMVLLHTCSCPLYQCCPSAKLHSVTLCNPFCAACHIGHKRHASRGASHLSCLVCHCRHSFVVMPEVPRGKSSCFVLPHLIQGVTQILGSCPVLLSAFGLCSRACSLCPAAQLLLCGASSLSPQGPSQVPSLP